MVRVALIHVEETGEIWADVNTDLEVGETYDGGQPAIKIVKVTLDGKLAGAYAAFRSLDSVTDVPVFSDVLQAFFQAGFEAGRNFKPPS